ncbi:MAG: MGMT family protein [Flavobacteriales bacterium]|jgi:methylated-DNA-protein-cysteine methyltransferase-like protein|nr:MGMT family protein [Flavobacteriales bacterium]MBK7942623.1 MGMT family protein [Flavobacteriales bacterium]MBK9698974.1 MGMT family protein [Flavobacteriales bacterium]
MRTQRERKKQLRDSAVQQPAIARPQRIPLRETPADKRDFFADVMDVVRQVPKGRVTSYGAIARYLGAARSARIVGYCMNNSHVVKPPVPAHRVVNSSGLLTGKHHFATPTRMEDLLKKEGVKVKDDQVVDFRKRFWDPAVELGL